MQQWILTIGEAEYFMLYPKNKCSIVTENQIFEAYEIYRQMFTF